MKKIIPLFSLGLGLVLGFIFFAKHNSIVSHEDLPDTSSFELKACENRVKTAQEEISRLQAQISELQLQPGYKTTEIAKVPTQTQTQSPPQQESYIHNNTPIHNTPTTTYKEQVQQAIEWMDGEKKYNLARMDTHSTSEFLKSVTIRNLDNVKKFTNTVERNNPKFLSLQGNFHGTMKSLDNKEYTISLELSAPSEGQISYTISIEGDDIHSNTRGNSDRAKGFSTLNDDSSKAIFIKIDKIHLQAYPTNNNHNLIGNAYRKKAKGSPLEKFAEFELTRN